MIVIHNRIATTPNKNGVDGSTVGTYTINKKFVCFVIEDAVWLDEDAAKVFGKTAIKTGLHRIIPRREGTFWQRSRSGYLEASGKRYIPPFIPHIVNDFQGMAKDHATDWVGGETTETGHKFALVHPGNTVKDTLGCQLPVTDFTVDGNGNYKGTASQAATSAFTKLLASKFDLAHFQKTGDFLEPIYLKVVNSFV